MSDRVLEYGPVSPAGGFFAADLRVGDVIRTPEGDWSAIVAIEDSPHGDRGIEVANGAVIVTDLVDQEIFEIWPVQTLVNAETAWQQAAARKAPRDEQAPLYQAFKTARAAEQSWQGRQAVARMRGTR